MKEEPKKPPRSKYLILEESPTSLSRVCLPLETSYFGMIFSFLRGNTGTLRGALTAENRKALSESIRAQSIEILLVPAAVVLLFVFPLLYLVLPTPIYVATLFLLVVAAVVFSIWFPRRTYFSRICLRSHEENVDWLKYWNILISKYSVHVGIIYIGIILILFALWQTVLRPYIGPSLPPFDLLPLFSFWSSAILSLLILYCVTLWRRTSISQALDEYHPSLAGFVADDKVSRIMLPARCHKGDSHNILLNVWPSIAYKSDYWEAELQAAGVKVGGEQTIRTLMTSRASPELLFFWNCNFETSGKLLVNVLLRISDKQDDVKEILCKSHEIRVITLYRQYATTLVTTVVAVLAFLFSLHLDLISVFQSLHI